MQRDEMLTLLLESDWVKFVERLPFSDIFDIIVRKVFTQIGTLAYHAFSGSMGIFDKGRR